MASKFTISVAPDSLLNIPAMSFEASLNDPTDFMAFLMSHRQILGLPEEATPLEVLQTWANGLMAQTAANVAAWVRQKKIEQVTVAVPDLSMVAV
jgi:hypothetical protein